MNGLGTYLRTLLRGGFVRLLTWPLATAAIALATAVSIAEFYSSPETRSSYAAAIDAAGGVMTAIGGASGGLQQLGGIIANELGIMLLPALAIAGIMLAIASTRGEEDAGRTELLMGRPVGRFVPLVSGVCSTASSLALLAALTAAALVGTGVPLIGPDAGTDGPASGGALMFGLLIFAYAMFFAGIGFVVAELAQNARMATGMGMFLFAALYFVRIGVNASGNGADAHGMHLSWLTPLGWFDGTSPFEWMRVAPMLTLVAVALVLIALAFVLRSRRDLGAGLIGERPGPTTASARLGTSHGIWWRLHRTGALSWLAGAVGFAWLMGSQLPQWIQALKESEAMLQIIGMDADASTITKMALLYSAMIAAAGSIAQISTWVREEHAERVSYLLAQPVSRTRLWAAAVIQSCALAVVGVWLSGAVYVMSGSAALAGTTHSSAFSVPDVWSSALVFSVPALLLAAVAAAWVGAVGTRPWLAWVVFGVSATFGFMGSAFDLPDWVIDLGVFNGIGNVPVESVRWVGIAIEGALIVVLIAAGFVGLRRRDVR